MTQEALGKLKRRYLSMQERRAIKAKLAGLGAQVPVQSPTQVKPKVRGIRYPSAARLAYSRALNGVLAQLEAGVSETLLPSLPALLRSSPVNPVARIDSLTDNPMQLHLFARLREKIDTLVSGARITWLLSDLAKQIENTTAQDFKKQMAPALGIGAFNTPSPDQLRALFVKDNVRLITSLPDGLVDQIERQVHQALRQGTTVKELERGIKDSLGLTKQRAQLIARDQVSKYSGDLTRHHQTSCNITHYVWETSRDERVRPEHRALDGEPFAWNAPPVSARNGGRYHPRQGINCRCDAIPVVQE